MLLNVTKIKKAHNTQENEIYFEYRIADKKKA